MKIAGLCVAVVVLTLYSSAGSIDVPVDQNRLFAVVSFMMNKYQVENTQQQVCMAVNVPDNQNLNNLDAVFPPNTAVWTTQPDNVYISPSNMVAAVPRSHVHAERRVLANIGSLIDSANGHFLLFYSFFSPCYRNCMNGPDTTIIPRINEVIPTWSGHHAFVFSRVFDTQGQGRPIPVGETREALQILGNSQIGRNNIYRCYTPNNAAFQCIKCFNNNNLVRQCLYN